MLTEHEQLAVHAQLDDSFRTKQAFLAESGSNGGLLTSSLAAQTGL